MGSRRRGTGRRKVGARKRRMRQDPGTASNRALDETQQGRQGRGHTGRVPAALVHPIDPAKKSPRPRKSPPRPRSLCNLSPPTRPLTPHARREMIKNGRIPPSAEGLRMSQTVTCPACHTLLRSDRPIPSGISLRCPGCRQSFVGTRRRPAPPARVRAVAVRPRLPHRHHRLRPAGRLADQRGPHLRLASDHADHHQRRQDGRQVRRGREASGR